MRFLFIIYVFVYMLFLAYYFLFVCYFYLICFYLNIIFILFVFSYVILSEGFVWKRSSKARVVTSKSDVNSNVMPQFIVVFMK